MPEPEEIDVPERDEEAVVVDDGHTRVRERHPGLPLDTILAREAAALSHPLIPRLRHVLLMNFPHDSVRVDHESVGQQHPSGIPLQVLKHKRELTTDEDLVRLGEEDVVEIVPTVLQTGLDLLGCAHGKAR